MAAGRCIEVHILTSEDAAYVASVYCRLRLYKGARVSARLIFKR
jgi:hypothetical protein